MSDGAIKYVGVDGCADGWIGIGLGENDLVKVKVRGEFSELLEHFNDACLILVDAPIGLLEYVKEGGRDCDKEARNLLKGRASSVFSAPPRPLVNEVIKNEDWKYQDAKDWLKEHPEVQCDKVGISSQTFSIIRKIGEVRACVSDSSNIREAHPEICFWALNETLKKKRRLVSKHEALGFGQRLGIVSCWVPNAVEIFEKVHRRESKTDPKAAPDDVLDALALAITAKIVWQNCERLGTLPKKTPPDSVGEMVYAKP